jgi:putative oxidoreductase
MGAGQRLNRCSRFCYVTSYESANFGLLLLRVVLGLTMAAHGYNKFFGKGGLSGTAGWFDSMGMKPGIFHARIAATTELSAGLGVALGLLTPIPAAGFVALMFVAAWTVHRKNGFFIVKEGWEYNLILAVAAISIATVGAGRFSLDYALFRDSPIFDFLHGWNGFAIAVVLGLAGGIGQLVIFYRPPAPKADAEAA